MGHKGRQGLTRKAQPGRNRSKIVSKFTSTQNVDKQMKTSLKAKGHQPRRNARAPRTVDVAKRAKLAREPSPAEPRPDGRFESPHPARRGRATARR